MAIDSAPATQLLLDIHEAAAALHLSERTAWGLYRNGRLRGIKIGRCLRFDPADLHAFIEAAKQAQAGQPSTVQRT